MHDLEIAMSADALLAEHNHEIESACCELLGRIYSDDTAALVAAYRRFESEMLEHLRVEEELILPAYAAYAPEDARSIRVDHDELRRNLFRIGVEVELHVVRATTVERLITGLRAHSAREYRGLYRWAASHLSATDKVQMVERIRRSRMPHPSGPGPYP